ncbi:MAG TPA: mannose-1-phosphate guanylyltransferase/mannose-6-phosphate isomerase [Xanthomonadaceae bacterium]|nr:mannose-1-phosphate guanylyltransferase/mannose-6-phosphate isomerase [Xanthomonadaceae bacterium]
MNDLQPVILSGGSGTRLWPLSREAYPKQFIPLYGSDTMLQATWKRVTDIVALPPIIVANQEHRFVAAEQLQQAGAKPDTILLEPIGRNTAPAIAIAALHAMAGGKDPLLLVLPSDHVIRDVPAFHAAIASAADFAEAGKLATFGIVPSRPETGYGYIKAVPGDGPRAIECFIEKPDAAAAGRYVASGEYYWNSGMFLFKASRYLAELERLQPAMLAACRESLDKAGHDMDFIRLDRDAFAASPADSIDYAVMEKTTAGVVIPLDAGWSDVGSWSALWEISEHDEDGNAHHGDVISLDCHNTYAYGSRRLVAMLGLDDIVVVETDDAVLVGHRDHMQQVKDIVAALKAKGRPETTWHRKVYRPWGAYDSIDHGERFQVKRITVKPGASLSLQMHHHRAEHWVVVSGTAEVTRGDETILLGENQSTYIPLGVTHRLRNPGVLPLELIEVQSGSYLGEDDIVRFEDSYGRQ